MVELDHTTHLFRVNEDSDKTRMNYKDQKTDSESIFLNERRLVNRIGGV